MRALQEVGVQVDIIDQIRGDLTVILVTSVQSGYKHSLCLRWFASRSNTAVDLEPEPTEVIDYGWGGLLCVTPRDSEGIRILDVIGLEERQRLSLSHAISGTVVMSGLFWVILFVVLDHRSFNSGLFPLRWYGLYQSVCKCMIYINKYTKHIC